jgi:hypothetical protein
MAKKKDPAAVKLGRRGGQARVPKGYSSLSKAERVENATRAAKARWAKAKKKAKA